MVDVDNAPDQICSPHEKLYWTREKAGLKQTDPGLLAGSQYGQVKSTLSFLHPLSICAPGTGGNA